MSVMTNELVIPPINFFLKKLFTSVKRPLVSSSKTQRHIFYSKNFGSSESSTERKKEQKAGTFSEIPPVIENLSEVGGESQLI